ncbi:MAG TPA: spherulation-specific family 4 protein, partial [Pilimelia sp.]|nr:spherulation-specific family 4 protein [Pilimelia sp.]
MPRSVGAVAVAAVSALVVGTGVWLAQGQADAGGYRGQRLAVPAYWGPDQRGKPIFDDLAAAGPRLGLVVLNGPASGPPTPFDPATAAQIRRFYHQGVTVLGYVDTGYLGRTGHTTTRVNGGSTELADWRAQAARDSETWFALYGEYGLDGVFLDQTVSSCGADDVYVDTYHALADGLRRTVPDAFVALNPGTHAEECYAEVADALVLFENTYATYRDWAPPSWVHRYPAAMFWHLVHDTPTVAEMRDAVARSRERHAGLLYVTNHAITETSTPWN